MAQEMKSEDIKQQPELETQEVEVLGYTMESVMESINSDLDASVEAWKMSDRNSRIIKAVMMDWFGHLRAHGVEHIDIRDE